MYKNSNRKASQGVSYQEQNLIAQLPGAGPFHHRYMDTDFTNTLCVLLAINTHLQIYIFHNSESINIWWKETREQIRKKCSRQKQKSKWIQQPSYDDPIHFGFPIECLNFVKAKIQGGQQIKYLGPVCLLSKKMPSIWEPIDCSKVDILGTLDQFKLHLIWNLLVNMEGSENHLWGVRFEPNSLTWWYFSNDEMGILTQKAWEKEAKSLKYVRRFQLLELKLKAGKTFKSKLKYPFKFKVEYFSEAQQN